MEELMKNFMIAIALIFVTTFAASAAGPNSNRVGAYANTYNISSDQDRCQAEADHMAANNITGHVWGVIGSFEGVGYGSSPNCNTCTPRNNMRLTGDASAQGKNGKWYRVRSWR
jgi:hypothetical protein